MQLQPGYRSARAVIFLRWPGCSCSLDPLRLVRVTLLVLIGFLQLLLAPKFLICVIGPVGTNSSDLALLACGWHVIFFADIRL
jgi:hypothetical protein